MTNFLKDDTGKVSTMRIMSFISLFTSILFGYLTIQLAENPNTDPSIGVYLTMAFLLGAFAPKVLQKFIENKQVLP